MIYEIIIPRPGEQWAVAPYRIPEQRWEEVTEEMYGSAELPTTISFDHDPDWRYRFWSAQNARDQADGKRLGFWTFIGLLFVVADVGGYTWLRWR